MVMNSVVGYWIDETPQTVVELVKGRVFEINSRFILKKLGSDDAKLRERAGFEADVLRFLAATGMSIVQPLLDKNSNFPTPHNGHLYALYPALPRGPMPLDASARAALFGNNGRTVARLHKRLARFPSADIPIDLRCTNIEQEIFEGGQRWLADRKDGRAVLNWLHNHGPSIRRALRALPDQLIHRDCHVGNFLSVDTDVVGVIDWEQLSLGPGLLDVAYFSMQLVEHPPANGQEEARWLNDVARLWAGYVGETAVLPQEKNAFPYLLLSIPFLFANWFVETGQLAYVDNECARLKWITGMIHAQMPTLTEQ